MLSSLPRAVGVVVAPVRVGKRAGLSAMAIATRKPPDMAIDKREGCSALLLDRSFGFEIVHASDCML